MIPQLNWADWANWMFLYPKALAKTQQLWDSKLKEEGDWLYALTKTYDLKTLQAYMNGELVYDISHHGVQEATLSSCLYYDDLEEGKENDATS